MVLGGTGSVWGGNGWHLVVVGQYNLVLLGIKWYWVGIGPLCLYVLKQVEIWLDVTIAGRTKEQTRDVIRCLAESNNSTWRSESF